MWITQWTSFTVLGRWQSADMHFWTPSTNIVNHLHLSQSQRGDRSVRTAGPCDCSDCVSGTGLKIHSVCWERGWKRGGMKCGNEKCMMWNGNMKDHTRCIVETDKMCEWPRESFRASCTSVVTTAEIKRPSTEPHTLRLFDYVTRSSATAKSTARPSCFVGVLYDISREKICSWLINHFYVISHESYRIRRNNAN